MLCFDIIFLQLQFTFCAWVLVNSQCVQVHIVYGQGWTNASGYMNMSSLTAQMAFNTGAFNPGQIAEDCSIVYWGDGTETALQPLDEG
jgi:hypothetical protein